MQDMVHLRAREEQLRKRLAELGARLHRIDDHLGQPPDPDWEDNAIEAEMDEVLEGLGHAGNAEIQAIYSALARIKSGTYGVCTRCGIDISEKRLDALPHTPLCRTCAREVAQKK
jgi:RNA polymerase-binding transcription factor DksA